MSTFGISPNPFQSLQPQQLQGGCATCAAGGACPNCNSGVANPGSTSPFAGFNMAGAQQNPFGNAMAGLSGSNGGFANDPLASFGLQSMSGDTRMLFFSLQTMMVGVMGMIASLLAGLLNGSISGTAPQGINGGPGGTPGNMPPGNNGGGLNGSPNLGNFTPENVARLFPESARGNIDRHLPAILGALREQGIDDPQMALYALSTIRVESSGFAPISEIAGGSQYEGRRDLGNTQPGDGERFKGRGFIQLTGRSNYESYGRELGVDLVGNPELANDPQIAARILALYLKRNESRLRSSFQNNDLPAARRVVNGGTNGLSGFSEAWRLGMQLGLA